MPDTTIRAWRLTGDEAVPDHESTRHLPPCVVVTGRTAQNTHAWIARTPDGEWGSLRIGAKGAAIDEHADGTISVAGVLTTRTGRAWRLERGEWMRAES